jgi:hypothetical protein
MSMMQNDESATPAVKLFQSAHSKLVTLQRINDQLSGILIQRQRVQEELKAIRSQIDEVFERELRQDPPSARTPAEVSGDGIAFRLGALEISPSDPTNARRPLEKISS